MDANEFKKWRERLKLTQDAAKSTLGVSRVTVQNWENGVTRIPAFIEATCEVYELKWKMKPEYGPVALIYFSASLWTNKSGLALIPSVIKEPYPDNKTAIERLRQLNREGIKFHNPIIINRDEEIIWRSQDLIREVSKDPSAEDGDFMEDRWYAVIIRESDVAELSVRALMNKFDVAYRAANIPKKVEIFRKFTTDGSYVYYFSPAAVQIAKDLLHEFYATVCNDPIDLTGDAQSRHLRTIAIHVWSIKHLTVAPDELRLDAGVVIALKSDKK